MSATSTSSLMKDLESFKEEYYNKNSKNTFFKKSQKADCAKKICEEYDIYELLKQTAYFIPSNNEIFFNYPMFKLFANEENYNTIIDYVFEADFIKNTYELSLILKYDKDNFDREKDVFNNNIQIFTVSNTFRMNFNRCLSIYYRYLSPFGLSQSVRPRSSISLKKSSLLGSSLYLIAISSVSRKIATTLVPSAAETKLKGTPRSSTNLYLRCVALSSISILLAIIMKGTSERWCFISLYQPLRF